DPAGGVGPGGGSGVVRVVTAVPTAGPDLPTAGAGVGGGPPRATGCTSGAEVPGPALVDPGRRRSCPCHPGPSGVLPAARPGRRPGGSRVRRRRDLAALS